MKQRMSMFVAIIGGLGLSAIAAQAQTGGTPVIGFLNSASPGPWTAYLAAFRKGLAERGYVDGDNVKIVYHWADGNYDQLPMLASDLVKRKVSVIVSTGGTNTILAAKAATTTIPIVFGVGTDPVRLGIVPNMNHPGGNITGINYFVTQMEGKRFGLLRELVPAAKLIAVLTNPKNAPAASQLRDVQEAARALKQDIHLLNAGNEAELEAAFDTAKQVGAGAMLVMADPYFNSLRNEIVALAAQHAVAAIYEQREHVAAGGLMSYGTSLIDGYRRVGDYTGRVLKGEKPGDLPIEQSTKFEFVINLKTAKALGLTVPLSLVSRADEVIE